MAEGDLNFAISGNVVTDDEMGTLAQPSGGCHFNCPDRILECMPPVHSLEGCIVTGFKAIFNDQIMILCEDFQGIENLGGDGIGACPDHESYYFRLL